MARVAVENLGPFRSCSLELRPLTVIIGRNSVGKSMLLYLLWSVMSLPPVPGDLEVSAADLAKAVAERVSRGVDPSEAFRELLRAYVRAFPKASARALEERLAGVFGVSPRELLLKGSERGRIVVEGDRGAVEFVVSGDGVEARYLYIDEGLVDRYEVVVPTLGRLAVRLGGKTIGEDYVAGVVDAALMAIAVLADFTVRTLRPFFASELLCVLLVDSRAGIARTLLKAFVDPSVVKGLSHADEHFIRLYYRLAEELARGDVDLSLAEPLLRELGVEVVPVLERAAYRLRVRTWTGHEVPFELAPSGAREALTTALALSAKYFPCVFIEEPEAHLHPRAQKAMARLIAKSVNAGKRVVVSTHSDYIVYTLNNLIALSKVAERAQDLGYGRGEVLRPEAVAAYLVKQGEGVAEVVRLEVGEEGFDESTFAEVVRELADERAFISL